jgi:hypothetical protein
MNQSEGYGVHGFCSAAARELLGDLLSHAIHLGTLISWFGVLMLESNSTTRAISISTPKPSYP